MPKPISSRLLLIFFSKILSVSALTGRSLIHFDFSLVLDEIDGFILNLSHLEANFSSIILKGCVYPQNVS